MLQVYEEAASFCAGAAALAAAGCGSEDLLGSCGDAGRLGDGGSALVQFAPTGWRAALLWRRQHSVYPQTSLQL